MDWSSTGLLGLAAAPLLLGGAASAAFPPQAGEIFPGAASATPVVVERAGGLTSRDARALLKRFTPRLPSGRLPAEGFLLETGEAGAVGIAADAAGERWLRERLNELAATPGGSPRVRLADWPAMRRRGLHVLDSGASSLPKLVRFVHEVLGPLRCNVLIYEIDYNFAFASHPELAGGDAWTRTAVGELVRACAEEGIEAIPQINCLGHQSWQEPPGPLLKAHPELEEPPDARDPMAALGTKDFYCRSWCPSHPDVNRIVFALMDELLDAFGAKAFHCGMDEVFVIASEKCPRCKGKDPAALFAKQVRDLHGHLKKRGVRMLMWGDRLLDGKATGYGDWAGSTNGTAPAIDMIPRDIVICDWHYDDRSSYPSLDIFTRKGFETWPTIYSDQAAALHFMREAEARKSRRIPGVLASIWYPAAQMADGFAAGKPDRIAQTAAAALAAAWTGQRLPDPSPVMPRNTFLDSIELAFTTSARGAVIRYTLDGTAPGPSSRVYAGPIRLTRTARVRAALETADGVSLRDTSVDVTKLEPREPDGPGTGSPGLAYACFLMEREDWTELPDTARHVPAAKGSCPDLDPALAPRRERYGLVFTGFLTVPADGLYVLALNSDDASRMYVGDELVVRNDGWHPAEEKSGEIALKAGRHRVRIEFIQGGGAAVLEASWAGPGFARTRIPASAWSR